MVVVKGVTGGGEPEPPGYVPGKCREHVAHPPGFEDQEARIAQLRDAGILADGPSAEDKSS